MTAREPALASKRILGLFPELLGVGGVQEAGRLTAAAIADIAARRGWSAEFLSLNDDAGEQTLQADAGRILVRGFGRSKFRFVCAAITRSRGDKCILLAAHPNLALPAACVRALSPNVRVIVMAHGVEVWRPLPAIRRRALLCADTLLVASRDTMRRLTEVQGASPKKIRLLPWPINPDFLRMAEASDGLALPPRFPRGQVILAIGRWEVAERYKGVDELIQAVAQLRGAHPSLQLVAVGSGNDLPRLQSLASDLDVADRVHFLQGLARAEIAACYAHADIFALPSTGEGFGIVYLEAMAFARPVVGAACGGTTDLIEDGRNGLLVPPHNVGSLTDALDRLLSDDVFRRDLGRRGAERVRQEYRFEAFEAELEKILAESAPDATRL
jgi:phosphatidylinositol alpha-1,6-mannosyltransferase